MRKQSDKRLVLKGKFIILNDTQLNRIKGGNCDSQRKEHEAAPAADHRTDVIIVDDLVV